MIGVIVSSFHIIFVPQVMNGIQKYASEHGYQILFYSSDFSFEKKSTAFSPYWIIRWTVLFEFSGQLSGKKYFRELASANRQS